MEVTRLVHWLSGAVRSKRNLFNLLAVVGLLCLLMVYVRFSYEPIPVRSLSSLLTPQSTSRPLLSKPTPSQRQLLLVTKGRSGSSYTSALIRNDDSVFYTFEPLYTLTEFKDGMKNATAMEKAYKILRAFLTCDFTQVHGIDLNNYQIRNSGPLGKRFWRCVRSPGIGYAHMECLLEMMRACREKQVTFSKVIRFPMSWAEPILQELPNLKIFYLIRDPRAVLHSQSKVFRNFKWPQNISSKSFSHCLELEKDTAVIKNLQRTYPNRVRVIQYERGAINQVEYAKDLYTFAGLEFSEDTLTFIDSLSKPENMTGQINAYSLHRTNSTMTMNKWRFSAGFTAVREIDLSCSNVYPDFGYLPAKSQRDLESARSLVDFTVQLNSIMKIP